MPFRIRPIFQACGLQPPTKGKPDTSGSTTRVEVFA